MESIDGHFHVVPLRFVESIRHDAFSDVVHIERRSGAERLIYHAPADVVVEPDTSLSPDLYDERCPNTHDRRALDF